MTDDPVLVRIAWVLARAGLVALVALGILAFGITDAVLTKRQREEA